MENKDEIFITPDGQKEEAPLPGAEEPAPADSAEEPAAAASAPAGPAAEGGEGTGSPSEGRAPVPEEPDLRYKSPKEAAKGGVLGFFIGLAVIVPGVSGSTVAIIFKLYQKLLYALGNIVKKFKKCAKFLLPIAAGLVIGFILGFLAIQKLIDLAPFTVIGLFAGLMLGAFPAVYDEVRREKKTPVRGLLFALGLAVPVAIAAVSTFVSEGAQSLTGLNAGHYVLFLALGYLVAVTQVVPGLSATAILMAFGYFTPIMESVHLSYWKENPAVFGVYACLAVGFLLGLVTFSKLLNKIFVKRRAAAFFTIVGLSLGSVVTMFFNPDVYGVYTGWAQNGLSALDLSLGLVLFAVGLAVAYLFVRYERKKSAAPPKMLQ